MGRVGIDVLDRSRRTFSWCNRCAACLGWRRSPRMRLERPRSGLPPFLCWNRMVLGAVKITLRRIALALAFATIVVGVMSMISGSGATWTLLLALLTGGVGITSERMSCESRPWGRAESGSAPRCLIRVVDSATAPALSDPAAQRRASGRAARSSQASP